jgi:Family of unknown function (DUF5946)
MRLHLAPNLSGNFETILTKEYSDFRFAKAHRLTVDTYCLQHPDIYMVSPQSFY